MIDETNDTSAGFSSTTTAQSTAFCQDCGKPLTAEEVRRVGGGVFCEPCLTRRAAVPPPPVHAAPGAPFTGSVPSPTVAGWLGIIPGVGAMYNGQFPKGFAHIVIFAVLEMFAKHVSDVFGIAVFGWVVYQVFDAVHTARARRDGLPLPDYFGLNNIDERLGHNARANAPHSWTQPQPGAPTAAEPEPVAQAPAAAWTPVPPVPYVPSAPSNPSHQANWAGYIPPTAFHGNSPYSPQPNTVPYQPVMQPDAMATPLESSANHFPVWAVVLIALGVIFMFANFMPEFHISGSWISALVLLAATAVLLVKRSAIAERMRSSEDPNAHSMMLRLFRFPIMMGLLSLLFILQALHVAVLGQTWPVLLVAMGVLLFADRAMQPKVTAMPPAAWPVTPPPPSTVAAPIATEERHE